MPPRKEPKEAVVYPSSKRKAPPFKPQRPSKVPRIPTTESESSKPKTARKPAAVPKKQAILIDDDEDDEEQAGSVTAGASDSDSELDDNPLASKPKPKKASKPTSALKKKPPAARDLSPPLSVSSQEKQNPADLDLPPPPTQLPDSTQIPQPLLLRLLHEHFADKKTKIDKHAIQVLQKYMEVFVREAIARTALQKREAVEKFEVSEADAGWLELEDLEKVAGGIMLDF